MVELRVARRAVQPAVAEAVLASLGQEPGCYFGVEAGVPGLHPLQATLLADPALALRVFGDGVEVEALTGQGRALLAHPALVGWGATTARAPGRSPLDALRAFLACFPPCADVLLLGALPFAAHRLAQADSGAEPLGVLFFGLRLLRRDAAGAWEEVMLELAPAASQPDVAAACTGVPGRPALRAPGLLAPGDDYPEGGYARMVERALPWLRERPLASLTLSQSYRRRVTRSPADAFARLRSANPAPACFFLNDGAGEQLLGASPDLQLVIQAGAVQALPVCGTVRRRPGAVGEAESLRELMNEEVDAASLAVCSDALRNDLAPLCEAGSLRLSDRRRPMSLATVVHAVDRLQGRLNPGVDAWDAIVATAAPVMVTGTPRAEALRAIDALEASPRGWYGGMVVQVAASGDALAGTILRAARVAGGVAEVRTGGDLMADSSPEREEQESRLKTLSVWRAFGLEPEGEARGGGLAASPAPLPQPGPAVPSSVRLWSPGDPFGAGLRDCLLGLGVTLGGSAGTLVISGGGPLPGEAQLTGGGAVAIGDAAARLLGQAGWKVSPCLPQHGRALGCRPTSLAPWPGASSFSAARYATLVLEPQPLQPGWEVWLTDEEQQPLVLACAGQRLVCLLLRPDSLLSEPQALRVLGAALAFAATARAH